MFTKPTGDVVETKQSFDNALVASFSVSAVAIGLFSIYTDASHAWLNRIYEFSITNFSQIIIWSIALFTTFALAVAIWPSSGQNVLGEKRQQPEFSTFSWLSLVFGAGMGVGLITWGIAEPLSGLHNNPDTIRGLAYSDTHNNLTHALKWTYLHWGLGAWSCYSIVGLAIAHSCFSFNRPLSVSAALIPLLGDTMMGWPGKVINSIVLILTFLCLIQTIGFAINELVICLSRILNLPWLLNQQEHATVYATLFITTLLIGIACLSVLSGLNRGVKLVANINFSCSLLVLLLLFLFGDSQYELILLFLSTQEYLIDLIAISTTVWQPGTTAMGNQLQQWQGTWSLFHWSWWVAFSPGIGLFLAQIAKGRTVREYVVGTIIIPSLVCIVWIAWIGGSAMDIELMDTHQNSIETAISAQKIFALLQLLFNTELSGMISLLVLLLFSTYLLTSINSALVVLSVSNQPHKTSKTSHLLYWSVLVLVAFSLLTVSEAFLPVRTVLVAGVIPVLCLMMLLIASLCQSIYSGFYSDEKKPSIGF